MSVSPPPGRIDRSALVKDAIRTSARRLFTADGFDATGIRDIAADAGVNPAIVIRHFGSKEALFVDSVDGVQAWQALLDGPVEHVAERAVARIMASREKGLQSFGAIVRASGRPEIHARLRESTITFFAEPLVAKLAGPDARLRAHLFAAQLTGLMSALAVYDDRFLREAPADEVVALYAPGLQRLLTGTTADGLGQDRP